MVKRSEKTAAKYYNSLPRKRAYTGVLLCDSIGQILILKPTYLDRWLCPGGGVEEGEAPQVVARRECYEEIGVNVSELWPAFINYREPKPDGQSDVIQFMFTTTPVDDSFLETIYLQVEEVKEAKFVKPDELDAYLSPYRAKSISTYLKNIKGRYPLYMENGELIANLA